MNLFKVFASARKGFQEEYASAILAWLLNPGLGFAMLAEFINGIAGPGHPLHALRSRLVTGCGPTAGRFSARITTSSCS